MKCAALEWRNEEMKEWNLVNRVQKSVCQHQKNDHRDVKNDAPHLKKWPCEVKKRGVKHEKWGIFEIALWYALLGLKIHKALWFNSIRNFDG